MRCPSCDLDLRIVKSYTATEGGTAVTVQELYCVNRQCPNSKSKLPIKQLKHYHSLLEDDGTLKVCDCGTVIVKMGETGFTLPPTAEYSLDDGKMLTVRCGECGREHRFNVEGKARERD